MTRIVVLGAAGMLGHKMVQSLSARYPDTWGTVHGSLDDPFYRSIDLFQRDRILDSVDAMDIAGVENRLRELRPDYVVNCIGVIKQRAEAADAIPSITINSLLPHRLAAAAGEWGGRVIHFSTDCVFDGHRGNYTEEDPSTAEDLYGKSKYLGEVSAENALTLRTSIIGRELSHFKSLLEWFLGQNHGAVRGFRRVIYSGVTTNYLADVVGRLIAEHPTLSGLYQVTSPPISKHDLLGLLRDAYKLDIEIQADEREVSDRSMRGEKFRAATGYDMPAWQALVSQLASDPTPYDVWRT